MATTDTNVSQVVVNKLTKAQYTAATKSPTEFYAVTDDTQLQVIAAGEISIGTVNANAGKRGWVSIPTQPDTNYAVMLTYCVDATGFATACLNNDLREVSRFEWFVWNFGGSTTGSLKCRYIVVKY